MAPPTGARSCCATFDLTGLPPTEEEVKSFLADASPDAFARVIDRLLASPHYGEQQARQWLDLAHYAEDQAHPTEGKLPYAWRYRDWVIEACNKDIPYDRFVKLQIAADLMEGTSGDPADRRALGFIGLGAIYPRPNDLDRAKAEQWDDRVDTLTRTFLALTVSCARCHDHKYDPIPTQDYYSLTGVIASTKDQVIPISPRDQIAAYDAAAAKAAQAAAQVTDLVQTRADRLAVVKADSLPSQALAVWSYNAKKLDEPTLKPDELAKSVGLDPAAFRALDNYLRKGGGRHQRLLKWTDLLPTKAGPREPTDAVRELAELFAASVKENLAKPLKQRNLDQQKDLFGEKGVFPLTEKVVADDAPADWKDQYTKLKQAASAATAALPPEPARCNGVVEGEKIGDLRVYLRGNPAQQGEPAPRRFLRILAGADSARFTHGSGRLELAEAIVDPHNPLPARVMVNRIWQQHFGRGIVSTPSNFGALGARPTHPQLLDYLADQFVRDGWSIKCLHRDIMVSAAYQRASTSNPANQAIDPENQWLWRVARRRLTVESLRDAVLMVTGNLDPTLGGPSVDVDDIANTRRTVYAKVSRLDLSKLLRLFDFPDPGLTAERRNNTTLPQQSLFLMNSPFILDRALPLAARFASEPGPAAQVRRAYGIAFARAPTDAEMALITHFLRRRTSPRRFPRRTPSRASSVLPSALG